MWTDYWWKRPSSAVAPAIVPTGDEPARVGLHACLASTRGRRSPYALACAVSGSTSQVVERNVTWQAQDAVGPTGYGDRREAPCGESGRVLGQVWPRMCPITRSQRHAVGGAGETLGRRRRFRLSACRCRGARNDWLVEARFRRGESSASGLYALGRTGASSARPPGDYDLGGLDDPHPIPDDPRPLAAAWAGCARSNCPRSAS